jgi:putative hydrolase of the HAD superfamily
LGIAELFHTVTISSLAHAAKPSPKIFRLALDQHAVEPAEAMHVGDSVRDDVEGATKAGLTAVLLARDDQQSPPGIQTIRALDELIPLALSRGGQNLA